MGGREGNTCKTCWQCLVKSITPIKDLYPTKGTNKICCPDLCLTCGEKDEIVQNLWWWRKRSHNLGGISNATWTFKVLCIIKSSRPLDMGFWKQFDHFHAMPMVWNPFIIKAKRSRQKEVYFKCIWVKYVALYVQCHRFSKLFITLGTL
jgi:hypothetical protein